MLVSLEPFADPFVSRFRKPGTLRQSLSGSRLVTNTYRKLEYRRFQTLAMKLKSIAPKPPMSIYYWAKSLGLAPFSLKNNKFLTATFPDKFYVAIFAAAYLILILAPSYGGIEIVPNVSSAVTKTAGLLYFVVNCAVTFIILVVFLLMSKDIVHLMNKLCVIHNELKSIGIDENLDKLFKNISLTTVTANVVIGIICLVTVIFEPYWPVHISIAYTIRECIRLNTLLIFSQILLCIGKRFTLLNKKLYELFKTSERAASADILQNVMAEKKSKKDDREIHIRKLEILHLELSELAERTTELFGIPILLNTISFLCELVLSSHWIYFINLSSKLDHAIADNVWSIAVNILCPILRVAIVAIDLIIIAYAATTTCEQGNTTKIVLFRVWNKFTPSELMDEFLMFSLQLLQKPVTVVAFGFFHLDYSYLYKIFCAMVAYLIMMIQFDTSQTNRRI